MKVKAKQLLTVLPKKETIIYNQCIKDAKNLNSGAKCLVNLMKIRDQLKLMNKNVKKIIEKDLKKKSTIQELKYLIDRKNNLLKLKKIDIKLKRRVNVKKNQNYLSLYNNPDNVYTILSRPKRNVSKNEEDNFITTNHLKNIARLEKYQRMCDYVKRYFDRISSENARTLYQYHSPVVVETIKENNDMNKKIDNTLETIINLLNEIMISTKKYSFLSPKLFSIIPSCKSGKCKNMKKILSPTLLSFHEDDGIFSLPSLLKLSVSNDIEVNNWLNLLLEIGGGGKKVSDLLKQLEPKIKQMDEVIYPSIIKIEEVEQRNKKIFNTLEKRQKFEVENQGYTFLTSDQLSFIYKADELPTSYFNILAQMSKDDHERRLEANLKELAFYDVNFFNKSNENFFLKRYKRAGNTTTTDPLVDYEGHHHSSFFNIFRPSAFINVIGVPVVFEAILLSPHAFIGEILNPEFGIVSILSPRAFVATILSPNALMSRILQPGFFRAEILTPRALSSWVLSPDIFIAEILSPKFLEAKILSPEIFAIQILSPRMLAPNIGSSENFALLVLSPSILSPTVYGKDNMIVEILSPHLLSGSHEIEENEHDSKKETNTTEITI